MIDNIQSIPIETGVFTWSKADSGYEIADIKRSQLVNYVTSHKEKYALWGGRCIVPRGHTRSLVNNILEDHPKLFTEFAGLGINEERIINFANRYGLLLPNYSLLWSHEDISSYPETDGETLEFWTKQVIDMYCALYIWQLSVNKQTELLQDIISQVPGNIKYYLEFPDYAKSFPFHKRQIEIRGDTLAFDALEKGDLLLKAKFFTQLIINDHCKEFPVAPSLVFDKEDKLKQRYRPSSLISLLWFQFFRYVTGEQKIKQCPICEDWYDVSGNVSRDGIPSVIWDKYCPGCGNKLYAKKSIVKKQYQQLKMTKDEILSRHREKDHKLINEWIAKLESSPKTP